jgi:multiple sugar transport system permease protein
MSTSLTPPAAPVTRSRRPRGSSHPSGRPRRSILTTLLMVAFFVYFVLPLLWLLISSTKSNADLFTSFGFWFSGDFNLIQNLRDLFTVQNGVFGRWMLNSAVYAIVSAGGAALLATAAGYGFALYEFAGKKALFGLILGAIAVPTTALAIPTYLLFAKIGIVNTPLAVILPSLISPFGIYLMRIYSADSVPYSLLESARLDGSGEIRTFLKISFPMLVPGFITVLLFTLVATWNNYFLPLVMLNNPAYYPTTVGLAQLNAAANAGGGSQALFSVVVTGSLVSIIPLIIAFLLLQRFWQSGLNTGSVK